MKTLVQTGSVALLLALVACGGSTPPVKPVEKNTSPTAAGSIKSPSEEMKERMSSTDASTAGAAGGSKKSK
jgi:hypothetical protein